MSGKNFHEVVQLIRKDDPRYEAGAYVFMRQALDHTLTGIKEREKSGNHRHVSGQELCEGIRDYALEQYGPMARTLLQSWGINQTEDFGQIVFNLVEFGIFGKTDTDSIEDFNSVYKFEDVFETPFRPSKTSFPEIAASLQDQS
ncbi:MAG: Minf_1886 family protein [Puniceicoccaceae bacterium]